MDILPKLLYVFQTVPLVPPTIFLGQLCKAAGSFIWAQKSPRIEKETLIRTKNKGGLALPDFTLHLPSASMIRTLDWFHIRKCKQWVTLEEDIVPIRIK